VRRRQALVLPGELDGWLRVVRSRRLEPTPRGSSCALAREGEKSRQKSSPKPSSSCLPPHAEGERRAGGVGTGARRGGVEPLRGEQAAPAPGKSGASRAPAPGRGRAGQSRSVASRRHRHRSRAHPDEASTSRVSFTGEHVHGN